MNSLIILNLQLLDQTIALITGWRNIEYSRTCKEVYSSTIGQHVRHCVEHYEAFFQSLEEGRTVDYEARPRHVLLEIDTSEALDRLEKIRRSLTAFPQHCRALSIRDTGITGNCASSITRELQFLASHTVHHMALIAVIAGLSGITVPENFGVAPSTLKHRENA